MRNMHLMLQRKYHLVTKIKSSTGMEATETEIPFFLLTVFHQPMHKAYYSDSS